MGTKEQFSVNECDASAAHKNANYVTSANSTTNTAATTTTTAATTTTTAITTSTSVMQRTHHQLPKASPPPQIIIVPATQASTLATNAAKKIRRAFSMPRNPFRWSRKFKTAGGSGGSESSAAGSNSALTSCVGGGRGRAGSIVSLNSYEATVCKDANGTLTTEQNNKNISTSAPTTTTTSTSDANLNNNNQANRNKHAGKHTAGNGTGSNRVLRRSSFRKFLNRIAQHVSTSMNVGANKQNASSQTNTVSTADRVPPISGYQWPADQTPGVMGLKNHGNTCFMNAVLQCLSHTDILAEYFVLDQYKADLKRRNKINSRKFGTKGELTEQLANVLKALWTCKNESDHSTSFKAVVDRYGSQFRSSTQHDAQEFLFWLLDKVHEDLNTATKRRYKSMKNTYGRPDEVIAAETLANHIRCNNSFVQAVFQAQFRSSLTCPRCKKQSNTFDPFHCISVQLPQLSQQTIFVTVVYLKKHPRQVKYGLTVPAGSPIVALREQLQTNTGISGNCMVLVDINKEGFSRVFYDTQPVATLNGIDSIYCIEVPEIKPPAATTTTANANEGTFNKNCDNITSSVPTTVSTTTTSTTLLILVTNVRKKKKYDPGTDDGVDTVTEVEDKDVGFERFSTPFSMHVSRDCSFAELQKKLLREMAPLLKPEVFSYITPTNKMFHIRLQDPSADPVTYLEPVEHPLLTEMIDLALSVLSAEAGPAHIKLLLEWSEPEEYFADLTSTIVDHESVARLLDNKSSNDGVLSLEQCLEHYTKAETLSAEDAWRCPHCQQYLPVVKTLGLWSLPDILVVHFKRFRQHQAKGPNAAKLTTMVNFPLNAFDMSPHLARGADEESRSTLSVSDVTQHFRPSPWKKGRTGDSRSSTLNSRDNKETRYDLYAVCYHQGDTLETGHYTAACKNPYDRQWYKFDDQRVTKVPNESIQEQIINNEAYMLFYQRRLGDVVECSGSSSNSGDHWVSRIAPPLPPPSQTVDPLNVTVEKAENQTEENEVENENLIAKAETKPLEIPKISNDNQDNVSKDIEINVVPENTLAQTVVIEKVDEKNLVDITEIAYADGIGADDEEDELEVLETLVTKINEVEKIREDTNQIFEMDEDCQINENKVNEQNELAIATSVSEKVNNAVPITAMTVLKTICSPTKKSAVVSADTASNILNHSPTVVNSHTNDMNGVEVNRSSKYSPTPNASKSTTSSDSSLSSRSSPHSLATSVNGASNLQTKFNGFPVTQSASANNNYKEALLSTSLKSNSSSIIGAAVAAHTHEFQLSRQQRQHWNGSRVSVSAVENGTHQLHQQTHGLNLRHSFSTSSNCKLRECSETLSSMLRNSANTCSKDTLIFIDQQSHHHHSLIEDDDDTFMGSRSLWISPVTPHKLITVSPKN